MSGGMNGHLPIDERITLLERELILLKKRVVHLESLEVQARMDFPPAWGLTPLESQVLRGLTNGEAMLGAEIVDVVYASRVPEERPEVKVIHVIIHRLRIKMRRHNVEIAAQRTGRDRGYYLPGPSLEIVRSSLVGPAS